jgi:glycogen debranching enzyme
MSEWPASGTPWSAGTATAGGANINLVDGTSFVVSSPSGAIGYGPAEGLFVLDTRILSRWAIDIDGWKLTPLTFVASGPFSGTFVTRVEHAGEVDAPVVLIQRRYVGRGLRESLEIRNHGPECELVVRLRVGSDFAGLFEVKAGRVAASELTPSIEAVDGGLRIRDARDHTPIECVSVRSTVLPAVADPEAGALSWTVVLAPGDRWETCLEIAAVATDGEILSPSHPCGQPVDEAVPVNRMRHWRGRVAQISSEDPLLERVVERSLADLGSLRIFDPDHVDRVVVAAGAPWFMALFGRDSILTSWMALPFDHELAAGVLAELADSQGTEVVERTEEQPGRILHEVRFDPFSTQLLGGSGTYYGTIDATPLFVMLVGELARWTGLTDRVRALLPAADRALDWIDRYGDRDGDGFVEYARSDPQGLEHQGWKDSWDGIRHGDGSVATPPIALCEVQGYVYAARRARAELARALGDADLASDLDASADRLAQRFDEAFWLPDRGWYAVGLDADKQPIRSLTSNIGHLLWSGIVAPERAGQIAARLRSDAMFSGFGIRTMAADEAGYNPLSYHCGSVWPHDTALAVAGLARYGFDAEAQLVTRGLLDAADAGGGRLPELFGGFARDDVAAPVPYPTSCSPQAWAAGSSLLLVRAMLGLEPNVLAGRIEVRPRIADWIGTVRLHGIPIGSERVDIDATQDRARVSASALSVDVR